MTSDTQTSTTSFPLVITTKSQQPTARLVLRNDLGQVVQQWLIKQNKCTLGSAASCALRCTAQGIAPYHALLVIGAKQTFVRALAPRLSQDGTPVNEVLLTEQGGAFELSGHRFELTRPSMQKSQETRSADGRMKFTLARPFALQNREIASAQPAAQSNIELRSPIDSTLPQPSESAPWVAKLIQSALEPLECRLQNVLEPINELQQEARKQQRIRRRRASNRKKRQQQGNLSTEPSAQSLQDSQDQIVASNSELQSQVESIVSRQSAAIDTLSERMSDINQQLQTIERIVQYESQGPDDSASEFKVNNEQLQTQGTAIEQLQLGIVAVSTALQDLQEKQANANIENSEWRQHLQQQLSAIQETVSKAASTSEMPDPKIANAIALLNENQSAAAAEFHEWKNHISAQIEDLKQGFTERDNAASTFDDNALQLNHRLDRLQQMQDQTISDANQFKFEIFEQLASLQTTLNTLQFSAIHSRPSEESLGKDPINESPSISELAPPPATSYLQSVADVDASQSAVSAPETHDFDTGYEAEFSSEVPEKDEESLRESAPFAFNSESAYQTTQDEDEVYDTYASSSLDYSFGNVFETNTASDQDTAQDSLAHLPTIERESSNNLVADSVLKETQSEEEDTNTRPYDNEIRDVSVGSEEGSEYEDVELDAQALSNASEISNEETLSNELDPSLQELVNRYSEYGSKLNDNPGEMDHVESAYRDSESTILDYQEKDLAQPANDTQQYQEIEQSIEEEVSELPSWWINDDDSEDPTAEDAEHFGLDSDEQSLEEAKAYETGAFDSSTQNESDAFDESVVTNDSGPESEQFFGLVDEVEDNSTDLEAFRSLPQMEESDLLAARGNYSEFEEQESELGAPLSIESEQSEFESLGEQLSGPESEEFFGLTTSDPGEDDSETHADSFVDGEQEDLTSSSDDSDLDEPQPAEDESVEDYMRKLLARMRGVPESEVVLPAAEKPKAPRPEPSKEEKRIHQEDVRPDSKILSGPSTVSDLGDETKPFDPEKYIPRALAPERTTSMAAMRELANSSARTAISKSTRQRHVTSVLLKFAIAGVGFLVAAVLMAINGLNINIGLIATIASLLVGGIWGYDAIASMKPLLQAGLVLNPTQPTADSQPEPVGNSD